MALEMGGCPPLPIQPESGSKITLPFCIRVVPPPFLIAEIPQDLSQTLEQASGVSFDLPYQGRSPAGAPLAGCPQRFGLATHFRFAQQLLATLLCILEIHHLVHLPWFTSS